MADPASSLDTNLGVLAQRRRRLLRQAHKLTPQARRVHLRRRPQGRHQPLRRRNQLPPQTLRVDCRSQTRARRCQKRRPGRRPAVHCRGGIPFCPSSGEPDGSIASNRFGINRAATIRCHAQVRPKPTREPATRRIRRVSMRACARVALVLVAVSASIGLTACSVIDDLKAAVSRWFDAGKSPGGRGGVFTDDLPDTTPMIPPEKPLKKEASKKKDKSKVQRPQTVEKKLPTSDSTEVSKPQRAEPQSVPSQPAPSQLRTLWPEAPAPGTFSR